MDIWRTTWSAWRSGALSPLGPDFKRAASSCELDSFVKGFRDEKKWAVRFFDNHPALDQEFLIRLGQGFILTHYCPEDDS